MLPKPKNVLFDSCPSTMDAAKNLAQTQEFQKSSFFVLTRHQTQGRGRLGSVWVQSECIHSKDYNPSTQQTTTSPYKNEHNFLPCTYALATDNLSVPLEWVSLLTGVALYNSFLSLYHTLQKKFPNLKPWSLFLKWPNDMVWEHEGKLEKISGVLCEAQMQSNSISTQNQNSHSSYGMSHIYIGIGINFFHCPNIPGACSFFDKILPEFNKNLFSSEQKSKILQNFWTLLVSNLQKYLCRKHTIAQMKLLVLKCTFPKGTVLSVNHNRTVGKFIGLNEDGALLLENVPDPVYSADTIQVIRNNRAVPETAKNSKNVLCFDFGNTRIHVTGKNFQSETMHTHIPYTKLQSTDLHKFILKISTLFLNKQIKTIFILSVSVNSKKITRQSLQKIKTEFQKILPKTKLRIQNIGEKQLFKNFSISKTFDQRTLGSDRALKCIFAYEHSKLIQKNVLIFSFGTATTCEGFSKEGEMIENFVFPGMQMSFSALHHFTALLPEIKADGIQFEHKPSHWTQKIYLKRGVLLSVVSSILTTAKLHAPCQIVLTGGNAEDIKNVLFQIEKKETLAPYEINVIQNLETLTLMKFHEQFLSQKAQ